MMEKLVFGIIGGFIIIVTGVAMLFSVWVIVTITHEAWKALIG